VCLDELLAKGLGLAEAELLEGSDFLINPLASNFLGCLNAVLLAHAKKLGWWLAVSLRAFLRCATFGCSAFFTEAKSEEAHFIFYP
jgi:hypothetical protein